MDWKPELGVKTGMKMRRNRTKCRPESPIATSSSVMEAVPFSFLQEVDSSLTQNDESSPYFTNSQVDYNSIKRFPGSLSAYTNPGDTAMAQVKHHNKRSDGLEQNFNHFRGGVVFKQSKGAEGLTKTSDQEYKGTVQNYEDYVNLSQENKNNVKCSMDVEEPDLKNFLYYNEWTANFIQDGEEADAKYSHHLKEQPENQFYRRHSVVMQQEQRQVQSNAASSSAVPFSSLQECGSSLTPNDEFSPFSPIAQVNYNAIKPFGSSISANLGASAMAKVKHHNKESDGLEQNFNHFRKEVVFKRSKDTAGLTKTSVQKYKGVVQNYEDHVYLTQENKNNVKCYMDVEEPDLNNCLYYNEWTANLNQDGEEAAAKYSHHLKPENQFHRRHNGVIQQEQRQVQLNGASSSTTNFTKQLLKSAGPEQRSAAETMIMEATARRSDPVHGLGGISKALSKKLNDLASELAFVNQQNQFHRRRSGIMQHEHQQVESNGASPSRLRAAVPFSSLQECGRSLTIAITPEVTTARGVDRAVISKLLDLYHESHFGTLPFQGIQFVVDFADKELAKGGSSKTDKDGKGALPRREKKFKVVIGIPSKPDLQQFLASNSPMEIIRALGGVQVELINRKGYCQKISGANSQPTDKLKFLVGHGPNESTIRFRHIQQPCLQAGSDARRMCLPRELKYNDYGWSTRFHTRVRQWIMLNMCMKARGTTLVFLEYVDGVVLAADGCTFKDKTPKNVNTHSIVDNIPGEDYYEQLEKKLNDNYDLTPHDKDYIQRCKEERKSSIKTSDTFEKTLVVNEKKDGAPKVIGASCGTGRMYAQVGIKLYDEEATKILTIDYCIKIAQDEQKKPEYGKAGLTGNFLFATHENGILRVEYVTEERVFPMSSSKCHAFGHGAGLANLILNKRFDPLMTKEEALILAHDALEAASLSRYSGGMLFCEY